MTIRESIHAVVWAARQLLGIYRVEEIKTLSSFICESDICIDIGAHAGSWSIPLSKLVPHGHVYAFEALPYYSDVLKMTLNLLLCKGVTVVNAAVQDKCQSIPIIYKNDAGQRLTGYTHVARQREAYQEAVVVPGITLDSFFDTLDHGKIRFIKCDVEGAELLVFRGAIELIEVMRPIVYSELSRELCQGYGYDIDEIFSFWLDLDYHSYVISSSMKICPIQQDEFSGNGDILFIPTEATFSFE